MNFYNYKLENNDMVYAQIKDNKVVNTIVVNEDTPLELFSEGYDYFLRIDEMSPRPAIGWSYDGEEFTAPPPEIYSDEYYNN